MYQHPLVVENLTKKFEAYKYFGLLSKSSFTAVDSISFFLKQVLDHSVNLFINTVA